MGKRKTGKRVRDGGMHIQPGKDGTMDMNTPYRCSAQPDPPSNAAVTTYVYDGYGNPALRGPALRGPALRGRPCGVRLSG